MTYRPEPWTEDALCTRVGTPEDWFPKSGAPSVLDASAVCRECPVQSDCLDYALRMEGGTPLAHRCGIYGGKRPIERVQLQKASAA